MTGRATLLREEHLLNRGEAATIAGRSGGSGPVAGKVGTGNLEFGCESFYE